LEKTIDANEVFEKYMKAIGKIATREKAFKWHGGTVWEWGKLFPEFTQKYMILRITRGEHMLYWGKFTQTPVYLRDKKLRDRGVWFYGEECTPYVWIEVW
jgi:hypothetical protein